MNDFLLFIGCVFAAFCLIGFFSLVGSWVAPNQQPLEDGVGAGVAPAKAPKASPAIVQPKVDMQQMNQFNPATQPPMHPSMPVVTQGATLPPETVVFELRQPNHTLRPEQRGHVYVGTASGGGKTQHSIAHMLRDMANGAAVYWLNPQYTLYHPVDQPTDLRGLDIIAIDDIGEIERCLLAALKLGEQRKPLYQAGLDVGQNVVLYLDETPSIAALNKNIPPLIKRVLLELRKMNVWIFLAAQGAQLGDLGLNGTAKGSFMTKYAKNLDPHSWGSLFLAKQPEVRAQRGDWFTEDERGGIVLEHVPMGQPLMGKGYVHTDPLGMRVPQSTANTSSAGAAKSVDRAAEKTSSIDDNNTLLSALMGIEKPVFSTVENGNEVALGAEELPKNRPNFKLIKNKLDRTIVTMLWAGISKTTIVDMLQWPDGQNLRSRPQQFKYINTVIEQAAALGIAFEGMAVLTIDND